MIFSQSIVGNNRTAQDQWNEILAHRRYVQLHERQIAANARQSGLVVNDGLIPRDVYQEFDNVTVERFRSDDGDTYLNDLLPLSRSVNIGRLVHKFRRASDSGLTQTSMTGQIGVKMDQVEYNYDGSIIPVTDAGFGRNWREWNAQSAEGFDALVDDLRETVAAERRSLATQFLDGHVDTNGEFIVVDGISWEGMRNDGRVAQFDLGVGGLNFDFTDETKTYNEIVEAFKAVRDTLYIDNNCERDATYYVSRQIMSNWERLGSDYSTFAPDGGSGESAGNPQAVVNRLSALMGVAAIKVTSKLVDNELMGFPLDGQSVRPIVGMGMNTVAMPRPHYNSNYEFVTWTATGFEVRTDYFDQKCAIFAQEIT